MNQILNKYFEKLETHLIESAKLAKYSSTDNLEKGTSAEEFVANLLKSHLPQRASITKHRQIVNADSKDENDISNPVDIIVYNEWTAVPNLVESGFVLAESVYLALEVKCREKVSDLKSAIKSAVIKQLPRAKINTKSLRPETIYFGNVRERGLLPIVASRTGKPTYGILGFLWGDDHSEISVNDILSGINEEIQQKGEITENGKKVKYSKLPWNWPDVIYIPSKFLAFKNFTHIRRGSDDKKTMVHKNEYVFIPEENRWPIDNDIELDIGDNKASKMVYRYLETGDDLNTLYAFIFWLSHEINKFAINIPDYHRYLIDDSNSLNDREGASINKNGFWETVEYDGGKWEKKK